MKKTIIFEEKENETIELKDLPKNLNKFILMLDNEDNEYYFLMNTTNGYSFANVNKDTYWGSPKPDYKKIIHKIHDDFEYIDFFIFDTAIERLEWTLKQIKRIA